MKLKLLIAFLCSAVCLLALAGQGPNCSACGPANTDYVGGAVAVIAAVTAGYWWIVFYVM